MNPEPNWQPIGNLPLITSVIDGKLGTAQDQYDNLLEARTKTHVLNDDTVNRAIQSYVEQLDFAPIYEKQLQRWQRKTGLTLSQQNEIQQLQKQVSQWKQVVTDILDLADKLKEGPSKGSCQKVILNWD
ncbi:hypothetical protein [Virgibacillus sp. DJP39]|uniref:hypothetical protein n=1 Tax=Virgibacillus sp. DJP39 TaxID=3409790 RepID=UPI003BB591BE